MTNNKRPHCQTLEDLQILEKEYEMNQDKIFDLQIEKMQIDLDRSFLFRQIMIAKVTEGRLHPDFNIYVKDLYNKYEEISADITQLESESEGSEYLAIVKEIKAKKRKTEEGNNNSEQENKLELVDIKFVGFSTFLNKKNS